MDASTLRRLLARNRVQLRLRDLALKVGRSNYVVVREDLARRYVRGSGIEVGALDRPQRLPPGVDVQYVDYLDKPGLIEALGEDLARAGTDPESIVHVEHVDQIDRLATFPESSLNFVIANHVLEHVPDPWAALINVHRVLTADGIFMLTLPDPRYSFDAHRQRTTVAHLRRDHEEGPASSRMQHYEEWARLIEGRAEADVGPRAADFAASDARHHFHVWELPGFLEFLAATGLGYELVHAQAYMPEFAVVLRKSADHAARR